MRERYSLRKSICRCLIIVRPPSRLQGAQHGGPVRDISHIYHGRPAGSIGPLVSRFRRSYHFAARSVRTSESKRTLATLLILVRLFGFDVPKRTRRELIGTSNPPH